METMLDASCAGFVEKMKERTFVSFNHTHTRLSRTAPDSFLKLSEVQRKLVELRLALSRKVRQLREDRGITQAALAKQIGSSQPRIAKLEAGEASVSLGLMLRGLFAVGGEVAGEMFVNRSARKPSRVGKFARKRRTRAGSSVGRRT